jgi:hypothetical protein
MLLCIRGLRRYECFCDCIFLSSEFAVDSGQYCWISYNVYLLISGETQRSIAPMNWLKKMMFLGPVSSSVPFITHCKTEFEFIVRPTVSRPVRLGIGLPFGANDQILSLSFFFLWQLLCSSCRGPSLTRGRVCNLQWNRWLIRSLRTNNHTLPSHLRLGSLFVASFDSQGLC